MSCGHVLAKEMELMCAYSKQHNYCEYLHITTKLVNTSTKTQPYCIDIFINSLYMITTDSVNP